MSDRPVGPVLSVILVSAGTLKELAVPLPGLLAQSVCAGIELLIVTRDAETARAERESIPALNHFFDVRVIEVDTVENRWVAAGPAIGAAQAALIALHENHVRLVPDTYERLLATLRDKSEIAAICPLVLPANADSPWGWTVYAMAHGHASTIHQRGIKPYLPEHQAIFKAELLKNNAANYSAEHEFQQVMQQQGKLFFLDGGTSLWHINESRPALARETAFRIGKRYGANSHRAAESRMKRLWGSARAPLLLLFTLRRLYRTIRFHPDFQLNLIQMVWPLVCVATEHTRGEIIGVLTRADDAMAGFEPHELDVKSRLNNRPVRLPWLRHAIASLPENAR